MAVAEEQGFIPDKLYFKIGEVSEILKVPAHVLRFWESQFHEIRPKRTASGQRLYRRKDVETLMKIKSLLYEKGFTIPGAKRHLKIRNEPGALLENIYRELKEILDLLD